MALPSLLHNKLRQTLMDNGPFDSNEELRGIFADPRLSQWRHSVPEATNRASRVNFTIAKLLDDWNANGENALYLFLVVLTENMENLDLIELTKDVRAATLQDKITACEQELKQIAEHAARGWSDPAYAASRKEKVTAELQQWKERRADETELQQWEEGVKAATARRAAAALAPANNGRAAVGTPATMVGAVVEETYTDIELHIFGKTDGVYPVKAELSDGSSFSGELRLDESTRQGLALDEQPESEALSQALFTGEMEKAYLRAETLAETTTGGRLRLRLWIDAAAAELQALRWERLRYQRNQKSFRLATAAHRPFSRYFGLGQADPEPLTARPIRLLAVLANPRNLAEYALAPLDVENGIASLLDALDPFLGSVVELTLLAGRTALPAALQGRLAQKSCRLENEPASLDALFDLLAHPPDYHILHFLGHGAYSGRRKQAALYFEDQVGNAQIVSDKSLAEGLHDVGQIPHLVFLAACDSAKREADANPFVGLAPRLIQVGVPAVVAMQDTISLANARTLTRYFYRFLFEHGIVDKAINQARRALVKDETQEYAIPALFTRLKAGRLFNFTVTVTVSVGNSTPIQPPPAPSPSPALGADDSALEMAKRTLEILERQVAAYTALTIPAHRQIELEEQRKKVAALEQRVRMAGTL